MNSEEVKKRIEEIDLHINQYSAKLNMLLGGKEELKFWLNQILSEEAASSEDHGGAVIAQDK